MDDNPDFLRSPKSVCDADPRHASVVVLTDEGYRPKCIEDQHNAVAALVLHEGVPEDIRIQFETVKNLYLFSWFVYRFYPVAQHQAYACLELALRERFESELSPVGKKKQKFGPGLKRLLSYAVDKGYLKNENFELWRRRVTVRARERSMFEAIEEMNRRGLKKMEFDENQIEIKEEDRDFDYLAILLKAMPWLRNHYAHGSKSLHDKVWETLQVVSEIINQIYAERRR